MCVSLCVYVCVTIFSSSLGRRVDRGHYQLVIKDEEKIEAMTLHIFTEKHTNSIYTSFPYLCIYRCTNTISSSLYLNNLLNVFPVVCSLIFTCCYHFKHLVQIYLKVSS